MKTWNFVDGKEEWGSGEWVDEPDKAHWVDPDTGFDCLIVRGPSGGLCGYVGVPTSHEHYGADYETPDVDVHGGLTFADKCQEHVGDQGVCHPKEDAAASDVWWLGFDCAHLGDTSPKYAGVVPESGAFYGEYRTLAYVKAEVESLAAQLRT